MRNAMTTALCRYGGSGGVLASLYSHNIGLQSEVRAGAHGAPLNCRRAASR